MSFKKSISIMFLALLICAMPLFPAAANTVQDIHISAPSKLLDDKISTHAVIDSAIEISGGNPRYLYMVFWDEPVDFTLTNDSVQRHFEFEGKFLHRLIEIPKEFQGTNLILLEFSEKANISEIKAFSEEPNDPSVQNWADNNTPCDLLLFSTHADDEQLFFAGTLPLYAADGVTQVQVVYFTDHTNNIARRHELLNGLWAVGVRRYPVISDFPDAYSESYDGALKNLKNAGFTENDALAFQVEQIRRFKPLVILGHDLKGEYGHGQHILNSTLLTRAVDLAADSSHLPESSTLYDAYDTPKLYLHLYNENQIELDLDTPKEYLDGKTPFEVSKEGFACHSSQQGTWFRTWLNGKNGEITKASQIKTYSPCKFGLYRTTVGEDVLKTDLFENVTQRSLIVTEEPILDVPDENQQQPEPQENSDNGSTFRTIIIIFICVIAVLICGIAIKKKKNPKA